MTLTACGPNLVAFVLRGRVRRLRHDRSVADCPRRLPHRTGSDRSQSHVGPRRAAKAHAAKSSRLQCWAWRWIAHPWQDRVEVAPECLASHPGESLHILPNGRGHVLIAGAPDSTILTFVSSEGTICGSITFRDFRFGD